MAGGVTVRVPVDRFRALTRGVLWGVAASVLGVGARLVFAGMDLGATRLSTRVVAYSIALCVLPLAAGGLICAVQAVRWLLLGVWPRPVGFRASEAGLAIGLGPFGSRRYTAAGLEVRYPFELAEEEDGGGFEAFLPEEQQLAHLLPRIRHRGSREALDRTMVRFAGGSESTLAARLRPVLEGWRGMANGE